MRLQDASKCLPCLSPVCKQFLSRQMVDFLPLSEKTLTTNKWSSFGTFQEFIVVKNQTFLPNRHQTSTFWAWNSVLLIISASSAVDSKTLDSGGSKKQEISEDPLSCWSSIREIQFSLHLILNTVLMNLLWMALMKKVMLSREYTLPVSTVWYIKFLTTQNNLRQLTKQMTQTFTQ